MTFFSTLAMYFLLEAMPFVHLSDSGCQYGMAEAAPSNPDVCRGPQGRADAVQ